MMLENIDVEKLKRMNALSKELKRHGMAYDAREAYAQAQAIIIEPKFRKAEESSAEESTEEFSEKSDHYDPSDKYLFEEKFRLMVVAQEKKFEGIFVQFADKIARLEIELEAAKKGLQKALESVPKEKQDLLKTEPKEVKESHPRQGNYTPDDVSLQKMFYFGNKSQ